jgi:hypothetical protein
MLFLALGVGALGGLLGFMVGVSSTPVAGVGVTSLFAIVASGLALLSQGKVAVPTASLSLPKAIAVSNRISVSSLCLLGQVLLLFSLTFGAGLWGGISVRLEHDGRTVPFPWARSETPKTLQSMIDWVGVAAYLRRAGHSELQIAEFYAAAQKAQSDVEPPQRAASAVGRPPPRRETEKAVQKSAWAPAGTDATRRAGTRATSVTSSDSPPASPQPPSGSQVPATAPSIPAVAPLQPEPRPQIPTQAPDLPKRNVLEIPQ